MTTLGIHDLPLFMISGLLLNVTPGQDTLYIVGRSMAQGRRAGLLSVLGIVSGSVVHTLAAAWGLSAILATSSTAFTALKAAGAAYLVYLGIRMLSRRREAEMSQHASVQADTNWRIYRAGLLTNVLNPKVAIFFMAFLPQFVSPDAESKVLAFMALGAIFIFNGTLWCLVLVMAASAVSACLRQSQSTGTMLEKLAGVLFIGLGVRLATTK